VVTVPSAAWLWQQGPKKSGHHDEHGHEEHEENKEEEEDGGKEDDEENSGDTEEKSGNTEDTGDQKPEDQEEAKGDSEKDEGGADGDEEGGKDAKAEDADKRPIGEKVRNEPPNEITATENKSTSGDEGLKEGPNDTLHKKSQITKSVDPDADEGKKSGPGDNVDKGHEGEEKGTRVTEQDKKRKVSDSSSGQLPVMQGSWSFGSLLALR
jgi:hypothetical protein